MGEAAEQLAPVPASVALVVTTTGRATLLRQALEAETEIRDLLRQFIKKHMKRNVDFGTIKGTQRDTLLKPGAEKLIDLFRAEAECEVTHRIEDWDKPLFQYEVKYTLRDRETKSVLAIGMGSANSREGKYRWRNGQRLCPSCKQPTILKSKQNPEWFCWEKKGGCGATFDLKDPAVIDQVIGKVENDDIYTQVNTLLKMAKKRAQVDGAIALARCSDLFTQDAEDFADLEGDDDSGNDEKPHDESRSQQRNGNGGAKNGSGPKMPYGGSKGRLVTDPRVPMKDLEWMAGCMREAITDAGKRQYKADNQKLLEALQVEILKRRNAEGDERQDMDERPGMPPPDEDEIPY